MRTHKKTLGTAIMAMAFSLLLGACSTGGDSDSSVAETIRSNPDLAIVISKAESVVHASLDAGSHYPEVWIRDLNTFLEFDLRTGGNSTPIRAALLRFIEAQAVNGAIPDGYSGGEVFKNTTESDQESSLVQAVATYVAETGDRAFLTTEVDGRSVLEHLQRALEYLWSDKMDGKYGLVWSGVTVDWGDVQAYSTAATKLSATSPRAMDIYTNAMFSIAIRSFLGLPGLSNSIVVTWSRRRATLDSDIHRWLWNQATEQYRPHLYVGQSPFPPSLDENGVFFEGGTPVAIQAGLLNHAQILASLSHMVSDMREAHADSIGITVYPPYPASAFPCCRSGPYSMAPYSYQNGGDWDWFGARMVQDLTENGLYAQAYDAILPMLARVVKAGNFYEWWTLTGEPEGSPSYGGAAGELGLAALQLSAWAKSH
jgi:hypothetical protein